ncbi:hypothetical protein V3595_18970 [Bacillus sp. CFBP9009]
MKIFLIDILKMFFIKNLKVAIVMQLPEDFKNFLGINPARHKTEGLSLDPCFSQLIIHKEIHGDKVVVPLDKRIWNRL